jgi:hypothetical protein
MNECPLRKGGIGFVNVVFEGGPRYGAGIRQPRQDQSRQ